MNAVVAYDNENQRYVCVGEDSKVRFVPKELMRTWISVGLFWNISPESFNDPRAYANYEDSEIYAPVAELRLNDKPVGYRAYVRRNGNNKLLDIDTTTALRVGLLVKANKYSFVPPAVALQPIPKAHPLDLTLKFVTTAIGANGRLTYCGVIAKGTEDSVNYYKPGLVTASGDFRAEHYKLFASHTPEFEVLSAPGKLYVVLPYTVIQEYYGKPNSVIDVLSVPVSVVRYARHRVEDEAFTKVKNFRVGVLRGTDPDLLKQAGSLAHDVAKETAAYYRKRGTKK